VFKVYYRSVDKQLKNLIEMTNTEGSMNTQRRQELVRLAYVALCVKGRSRRAVHEALCKDARMSGLSQAERARLAKEIISEAL
jgi:hypothetical protein